MIAVINLVLTHPFNSGIASETIGQAGQVIAGDVALQSQSTGSDAFRRHQNQGLIGPGGGRIHIENAEGEEIAFLILEAGFLKDEVLVTLQEEAYEAPPGRYDYLKMYEDEVVTQIGPQVRVTFPYSAMDVTSTAEIFLIYISLQRRI